MLSGLLQRYTLGPDGQPQIHSFYLPTDTPSPEAIPIGVMDNKLGALVPTCAAGPEGAGAALGPTTAMIVGRVGVELPAKGPHFEVASEANDAGRPRTKWLKNNSVSGTMSIFGGRRRRRKWCQERTQKYDTRY